MNEQAVRFGTSDSLVGIVASVPEDHRHHASTGVILLNAGIVHRVGAGRVYVKLARALAETGFVTLRFDFSGIGDSPVRHDGLGFPKSAVTETQDAMDFLSRNNGIRQFILLGGCSGAKIAFDTALCDARVVGALLINFPSPDEDDGEESTNATQRSALFYYRRFAFFNLNSWQRLFTGNSHYQQLMRTLWFVIRHAIGRKEERSVRHKQFRCALTSVWNRGVRVSFICSEGDHRLDDLRDAGGKLLTTFCKECRLAVDVVKDSDHTFSSLADQKRLMHIVLMRAHGIMPTVTELPMSDATAAPSVFQHQFQS